jgi:hypothetical protein
MRTVFKFIPVGQISLGHSFHFHTAYRIIAIPCRLKKKGGLMSIPKRKGAHAKHEPLCVGGSRLTSHAERWDVLIADHIGGRASKQECTTLVNR